MTLYETLDIPANADSATVKRAYKQKAKQTHPDKGGTADQFAKISRAYLVLSDPIRRARYDSTGDIPEITPETAPLNLLVQFFVTVVQMYVAGQGQDPTKLDLVRLAREQFCKDIHDAENQKGKHKRNIDLWKNIAKRFHSKKSNTVRNALNAQVQPLEQQLRLMDEQIAIRKDAIKLLDGYTFEFDSPAVGVARAGFYVATPLWAT